MLQCFGTSKKWTTVRNHLKIFNENLKYEDITDKMLSEYVLYCAKYLCMLDSSIQKELSLIRWFLRWAQQKGYHNNGAYEKFRARFKESKQLQALTAKRIGALLGFKSYAVVFSKLWNCQTKFLSDNAYSAMGSSNFTSLDNQLREVFPEYKEKEE